MLPWCAEHDVGVLAWAPLNGGWLTGKYQSDSIDTASRAGREPDHFDHRDAAIRDYEARRRRSVDARSPKSAGLTLIQLALGFVVANPAVTAALIGPRTPEQLPALLAAADVSLSADVLAAVDAIVTPGVTINPVDNG